MFGDGPFDGETDRPNLAVGAELPAKSPYLSWLVVRLHRPDVLGESHQGGIRIEYDSGLRHYGFENGPEHTRRPGRCF